MKDAKDGTRLWETVRAGMRKIAMLGRAPTTIGSLQLSTTGRVTDRTGVLQPFSP